jgi:hypothetical protein
MFNLGSNNGSTWGWETLGPCFLQQASALGRVLLAICVSGPCVNATLAFGSDKCCSGRTLQKVHGEKGQG